GGPVELVQVHRKGQITLPQRVRRRLGLKEGDLFEVEVREDEIILHRRKLVDASQAYFWTEEWQRGERQASEDIRAGRVTDYPNAAAAIADLHSAVAEMERREHE